MHAPGQLEMSTFFAQAGKAAAAASYSSLVGRRAGDAADVSSATPQQAVQPGDMTADIF